MAACLLILFAFVFDYLILFLFSNLFMFLLRSLLWHICLCILNMFSKMHTHIHMCMHTYIHTCPFAILVWQWVYDCMRAGNCRLIASDVQMYYSFIWHMFVGMFLHISVHVGQCFFVFSLNPVRIYWVKAAIMSNRSSFICQITNVHMYIHIKLWVCYINSGNYIRINIYLQ